MTLEIDGSVGPLLVMVDLEVIVIHFSSFGFKKMSRFIFLPEPRR